MRDMANALVGLENMNAITMNWGDLSTGRYDCVVKKNIPGAGTSISYFNCSHKSEAWLEPCQTSIMKHFCKKIVNGFQIIISAQNPNRWCFAGS